MFSLIASDGFTKWYLRFSGVAIAALIVIAVILLFSNNNLSHQNQANIAAQQKSNIEQCQLANVTRIQDIAIWNRLLNVPPTAAKTETPAQRAEIKDLERLVRIKDTPRNCKIAYKGG